MFERAPAREPELPAVGRVPASDATCRVAPSLSAAPRGTAAPADALGASLARAVARRAGTPRPGHPLVARAKQRRTPAATAPRVRPPHDIDTEPFAAAGVAGTRTKKVTARLAPTTVPERGKTPLALAYAGGTAPLGFDGGHVIGLHLGGANVSANVVPMYPRFNRGVWKALEDQLKTRAATAQLKMAVTMTYAGTDPRIPSSFDVEVTDVATGTTVLSRRLSQPGDIPDIAAMPADVRVVLTAVHSYAWPLPEARAGLFELNGTTFAAAVAATGGRHLPVSSRAMYPDRPSDRPYGTLDVLVINGALTLPGLGAMGAFTDFSATQRELILQVNRERNGGTIRSDDPADPCPILDPRGAANAPEIDHIIPEVLGGSNYFSNARVVSWQLNNKEDRIKPISELVDVSRLAAPSLPNLLDAKADVITAQWLAHHPTVAEVAPNRVLGWITDRWPALGPEGVSPRLLKAVMAALADAGVKPAVKLGPKKGITKPTHAKTLKDKRAKRVRRPRSPVR